MKIDILTLFPEMLDMVFNTSIIGRARQKELIDLNLINIRHYSNNKHKSVDDYPFGGGAGMVMQAQPVFAALRNIKADKCKKVIYLSPKGKPFNQETAKGLLDEDRIVMICGHYEGIDQRIIDYWVTDEMSIGDYVLTGGEIPAMVLVDTVARMIPGVLSSAEAFQEESIYSGLLEHPQYTRPRVFEDMEVPEVLISGHHKKIEEWQFFKSLDITRQKRQDLFKVYLEKMNQLPEDKQKLIKKYLATLE